MFFDISLYVSLIIFSAGLIFKISRWFTHGFASDSETRTTEKLSVVLKGIVTAVFSTKIVYFLYSFIVDGLLQVRILKTSFIRWFMHFCIFFGFILLVIMHVFDETITAALFIDYAPTLNPFMYLRNILGVMVLAGVLIAVIRRLSNKDLRRFSNLSDYFLILLTTVIIASGFFLEASKIVSEAEFDDMVTEYSDIEDEDELAALKAYWAKDFSVVFSEVPDISDGDLLEAGLEIHEDTCESCHSKPESAFGSFALVKLLKPAAQASNQLRADLFFFYIHFLSTFIAMAILPFTKAFHLISTPLSMSLNRVFKGRFASPEAVAVKRMIELDACMHCGACTRVCSVGPINKIQDADTILPSEKILGINKMVRGKGDFATNDLLLAGSIVCTDCYRCNDVCPAGIDLKDIWQAAKEDLELKGLVQPHILVKQKKMHEWGETFEKETVSGVDVCKSSGTSDVKKIIDNPEFFSPCIQCTTCANVCPVVANTDGSSHDAGMSPQQVMNFLRLEMREMAYVSGLTWNCATCYMCQEHCPQAIPVADIICELRIQGFKKLRNLEKSGDIQE